MSKAIVQTLRPDSRVVFRSDIGYYIVEDRGQQIGLGANTPQDAWHEASVFLRGENYEAWFDAARKPQGSRERGVSRWLDVNTNQK